MAKLWLSPASPLSLRQQGTACQGRIGLGEHKRYDKEESQHSPFVGTSVKCIGRLWGSSLPFWSKSLVQVARVRWGRKGAGVLGVAWLRPTHSLSPSIACTERPASPSDSNAPTPRQPHNQSRPPLHRSRSNKWIQF